LIHQIEIVSGGLLLYLLLCGLACLAGYGLLKLLGLATASPAMILFAPVATLVFWSLAVGIAVGLRVPMKEVTPWLWGITAMLVINGLRRPWPAWRYESGLLLFCAALPIIVMARYFWYGLSDYSGTIAPDGWAYISYGQYLWEYRRGIEGGLAPLYQFASHLSSSRYISSALLGFLSPLVSTGDTQAVSSLLQAWTLFGIACAVAFFWATETTKLWMIVTATALSIVAGWIANLIWANNFDNGLALVYTPAFTGIVTVLETRNWRWWVLLGSMLAGLLYAYPELAPLIIVSTVLIALPRIWRERDLWRAWLRGIAIALAVAFVFVLPGIELLTVFALSQMTFASATTTTVRPGEGLFRGLIAPKFVLAAIWGLGGEHQITSLSRTRSLLGIALTSVAALGTIVLLQRRKWGLAGAVGLLLVGAAYFIIRQRYSYAAYKLIVLDWWGMIVLLMTGIDWAIKRVHQTTLRRGVVGGFALLLVLILSQSNHINADTTFRYINSSNQQLSAAEFRQLREIKAIVGSESIIVLVNEWLANEWAVYYLRDIPIDLIEYRMYMAQAHVLPTMQRAQAISPGQARYVLTDAKLDSAIAKARHWRMVWSGGPYQLWQPENAEWAAITNITNANGIEQLDGERFFWVGNGPTVIHVLAAHTGVLQLSANLLLGPSLPEQPIRRLQVAVGNLISQTVTAENGYQVLAIPAAAGENTITLTPLDEPSVAVTNGTDSRPLLLGVKGLAVVLQQASASSIGQLALSGIENPNGLERVDGQQFFWIGQGTTVLHVKSNRSGMAQLSAQFLLGPSLPEKIDRRLQITTNHGYQTQTTLGNGVDIVTVPIIAGTTNISIKSLDTPSQSETNQGDTRPLLLGVKGLQIWFREQ
jgi:hypothetical protein